MDNPNADPIPNPPENKQRIFVRYFVIIPAMIILALGCLFIVLMWSWANPTPTTRGVALGDLDGDGDLDAFYANGQNEGPRPNTVLINQVGTLGELLGVFKDSGQRLGKEESRDPLLADLDGDGDLDAWVVNMGYQSFYWNDGLGNFSAGNPAIFQELGGTGLWDVALGDLDGDGDLDAVGAGCCGATAFGEKEPKFYPPFNAIWFNQAGEFRSDFEMTSLGAAGVALGDLDGDGDLDAFFANDRITQFINENLAPEIAQPDTVWINPGDGLLADSGQRLGSARGQDVALGDLDGDGDLDAFVANRGADEVWLNDGQRGEFSDSGQRLGSGTTDQVILNDLDGDSDLDALLVVENAFQVEVWFNDGHGGFLDSGQRIVIPKAQAFTLGDLDGDGDADLFAGWYEAGYAIWWNRGNGTFKP